MTSVSIFKQQNSELQGCTTLCLREDNEIITPCELKINAAARSAFYVFQQLSSTPSLILETNVFLIAAAGGVGAGILIGIAKGIIHDKCCPERTFTKEWYDWATAWAAQKPCTRGVQAALEVIGSTGNVVASIFWKPRLAAVGNGAFVGINLGYNASRFATQYAKECLCEQSATSDEETPIIKKEQEQEHA